jgi:hypothetical protein
VLTMVVGNFTSHPRKGLIPVEWLLMLGANEVMVLTKFQFLVYIFSWFCTRIELLRAAKMPETPAYIVSWRKILAPLFLGNVACSAYIPGTLR